MCQCENRPIAFTTMQNDKSFLHTQTHQFTVAQKVDGPSDHWFIMEHVDNVQHSFRTKRLSKSFNKSQRAFVRDLSSKACFVLSPEIDGY